MVNPRRVQLTQLNEKILSTEPMRLIILHLPSMSPDWDEWLSTWVVKGRAHRFATMPNMKFRAFGSKKEQWVAVTDTFDWYMVDSGTLPIGVGVQKNLFTLSLKKLLARKRGSWRDVPAFSSPSVGAQTGMPDKPPFQPRGGALFSQSEVDQFWDKWNYLVNERIVSFERNDPTSE